MYFTPVGHITGLHSTSIDVTARIPWVYIIVAVGSKILYIGETYEQSGLVGRLSSHFGMYKESTLKQQAAKISRIHGLRGPYLIVCTRLPLSDKDAPFDGSSKQVRLAFECLLHETLALEFVASRGDWTIVSTPQATRMTSVASVEDACKSVYRCFESAYAFLETISRSVPFQLVILDCQYFQTPPTERDLGELIEDTEMLLYQWMLEQLQEKYTDEWWVQGIPMKIRRECAARREEELGSGNESLPAEAYFTLIDLREIAQKNWALLGSACERIAGSTGKEKGTQWLIELNEARKFWAHPIKRMHAPVDPIRMSAVRTLANQIRKVISEERTTHKSPS